MLLENKKAIVTGCTRGIGKAILLKFVQNGADVFAHARTETEEFKRECKMLADKYHVNVTPIYFDARNSLEIKNAAHLIGTITKDIDILVNNLGALQSVKLFQMTSIQEMKEEFDINFFAQIEFTQYISRYMARRKKGSIINISSCAGIDGNTGMLQYVSSKAAIIGATKRLAIELSEANIRVNSVAPGLTETDMAENMTEELTEQTLSHCLMKRKAKPEEIADAVAFFASDMSSFITGQVLRVDGGLL